MANLNPMGITSGVWAGNFQQPGTAAPAANPAVASYAVGANSLNLATPLTPYVQPDTTARSLQSGQLNGGPMGVSGSSIGGSKP
jgi:hypothetical protein